MATTPPPPTDLRVPPTPRHGSGYDHYDPYPTRHSARLASQRSSHDSRSASPSFPDPHSQGSTNNARKLRGTDFRALSPAETSGSPRKKGVARAGVISQIHSLSNTSEDPFITTAPSLPHQSSLLPPTSTMTDGMLPTPAKTPKKKAVDDAGSTARSLFPSSSMTSRGKKSKKPTAYSLESFEDNPSQNQATIEIYTDSRDRIPEVDEGEGNPFNTKHKAAIRSGKATSRSSRSRKAGEVSRDDEVDKALHRDDGMFYVFRGKRFFRKFNDQAEAEADDDSDSGLLACRPDLMDPSMANPGPLTRSSIKPRVLFPSSNDDGKADDVDETDEEAATDVEDNANPKDGANEIDHGPDVDMHQDPVTPPAKSIVTPPSPGGTIRTLRSRAKRDFAEYDTTPTAPATRTKTMSPFAGWQRKKQSPPSGTATPKRRDARNTSPGEPAAKRTRSNRATLPS